MQKRLTFCITEIFTELEEIAGYRDALAQIHTDYKSIHFTETDILRLHAILLNVAGYPYAGKYKDNDNAIIEMDNLGRRRVRFSPTPARDTPQEMEQLIPGMITHRLFWSS